MTKVQDSKEKIIPSLLDRLSIAAGDAMVPLVPHGITPNQITLIGLGSGICAALSFYLASCHKAWLLAAAVFVTLHIILDCLDGSVARQRQQTSKSGAFLDLFCDCIALILIPLGLASSAHSPLHLAIFGAIAYPMHSVLILQWAHFRNKVVFPHIGPADVHLGYVMMAILTFFQAGTIVTWGNYRLGWVDLLFTISMPLITLDLFISAFNLYRELQTPQQS
jgi:phosphatidylglycerophosphate synthase